MSLHRFLTRLIWLCVIPLLLAASWLGFESVRATQNERDIAAANLAQNLATAIDQHLAARIAALQMLAASPLANAASPRRDLYREAQGFRESFGAHVILADRDMNMLFNTRAPFGTALPMLPRSKGRAAAPAALETGAPAVGDIVPGPIAGEPLVAIAVPGKRDGKTSFLLLATFETRQFQQRLDRVALPVGWSLALVDGSGAAIARRTPPGLNSSTDVDAAGRIVAKSALAPWSVVLEIPRDIYLAPLLAAAAELALLILAATLVGVFGGLLASHRLGKSVASLAETPAPDAAPPEIAEIAEVRRLIDRASAGRAAAEATLGESEARYRALFENSMDGVLLTVPDGGILAANSEAQRILGYVESELCSMGRGGVVDAADPRLVAALAEREKTGRFRGELTMIRKDGTHFPAELSTQIFKDDNDRILTSMILRDVTERRQAEDALRVSEARYRTLFEYAPDGIVVFRGDATSHLVDVNTSLCQMLGYPRDELIALRPQDIVTEAEIEQVVPAINLIQTGSPYYREWQFRRKDGSAITAEVIATTLPDGNLLALIRDITARKRAAAALVESRARLEALTRRLLEVQEAERRMIANELHDEIGGTLTAVKLNLQALRRAHTAELREAALLDGLALVDGAIATVRSLSLDLRPAVLDDLGLVPALKWYSERQAQRAGVTIDVALDAIDLKAAPQLENACFRIVQEAVTNALRHAGARRIQVTLHRENERLAIEIADDGGGFDPAAAQKRGLAGESSGLLGMEERTMLLGGRLRIDSMPGAGTRVRAEFALPDGGVA